LISNEGEILVHHRKLVPTFFEKLIWAPGDGAGLRVAHTSIGNIGGLICGENTNPLARFTLMTQKEQIHISSWPPIWPTRNPTGSGNYNNLEANRIRASAHSFEAKCFGIVCAGFMDKPMFDFLVKRDPAVAPILEKTPGAESFFVNPTGAQFGQTLQKSEGIIYAEFDLNQCIEPKQFHDVVGYYNRFDVFDVAVSIMYILMTSIISIILLFDGLIQIFIRQFQLFAKFHHRNSYTIQGKIFFHFSTNVAQ
jgi:aliphatic nitrilase